MSNWDWAEMAQIIKDDGPFPNMKVVANWLDIPYGTVVDAFKRGDLPVSELDSEEVVEEVGKLSFKESGNEATLRFNAGEPLTAGQALEVAGIDTDEWRIVDQSVNMWQVGRKDKRVNLKWVDGKVDGTVDDTGKIHKTYLYQITVKLTRINRVAVKAILTPIQFKVSKPALPELAGKEKPTTILFIADPHFGFVKSWEQLHPMHHRPFLSSLLSIAATVKPDITVWNGDALDLADFSTFNTPPDLLQQTQLAGIELAWLLSQFRQHTGRQVLMEGNHEKRLEKYIAKNFAAAYQLKPVHELSGPPLMSVSRFLGLDSLDTEWIGDYPSGSFKFGSARFYHGNTVRKGSAKTVSAEAVEATSSRFFGHIHRYELAQKFVEDSGEDIWIGSPGCACDKRWVPGANLGHNWQLGAFLIHFNSAGRVANVETIKAELEGPTWFRGGTIAESSYFDRFFESLPDEFQGQY